MKSTLMTRRTVLGAAASSVLIPRFANAAEFNLKIGSEIPAVHPSNVQAQEAARRIKEETGGRVEITVYPNNQLGSGPDMLSQVRSGALEFVITSTQLVSTLVPVFSLPGLGFAFKNADTALAAMDGDVGAYMRKQLDRTGLSAMPKIYNSGFRQVTSSKAPIVHPEDFDGLKMRVPASPMWVSLFKSFGTSPVVINFAELYTSLQTKVVDAQENPLILIESNRLYEVQQYCTLTNHMWDGHWILANNGVLARLPADLRAVVTKHFDRSAIDQRVDIAKQESQLRERLTAKGLKFNEIQVDPFKAKLRSAGFYSQWREKFGQEPWQLLEKYTGPLA